MHQTSIRRRRAAAKYLPHGENARAVSGDLKLKWYSSNPENKCVRMERPSSSTERRTLPLVESAILETFLRCANGKVNVVLSTRLNTVTRFPTGEYSCVPSW